MTSSEHLGTWSGTNTLVAVTITVAGTPDSYTAKLVTVGGAFYGNWHGGKADADGNVVFDTVTLGFEGSQLTNHLELTLGPVRGDTMTVTFNTPEIPTQEVEVKRQ